MKKRLTAAFLCLGLLFTLRPATAFAKGGGRTSARHRSKAPCANTTRSMTKAAAILRGQMEAPAPMNMMRAAISL